MAASKGSHHKDFQDILVSILKLGILAEIEAWEKFYRRHIIDIPRIKF
jgi:hypothetical protein